MLEYIQKFLEQFNLHTIISMGLMLWYFSRNIKGSLDALDKDVRAMNTRMSRLEGTVYGKDVYKYTGNE